MLLPLLQVGLLAVRLLLREGLISVLSPPAVLVLLAPLLLEERVAVSALVLREIATAGFACV